MNDRNTTRAGVLLGALVCLAAPALGQETSSGFEHTAGGGIFIQYTSFDENAEDCLCLVPRNGIGFGARLAYPFSDLFAVEVDGSTTNTDRAAVPDEVRYSTLAARVRVMHPLTTNERPLLGLLAAGPMVGWYDDSSRFGLTGLAGLRWDIVDRLHARVDGFVDYMPDNENMNLGLRAGLGYTLRPDAETMAQAPPPAPAPDTVIVERPAPPPPLPDSDPAQICLASGQTVTIHLTPEGDTLVGDRRIPVEEFGPGVGFAGEYAGEATWFIRDEPILLFADMGGDGWEYRQAGFEVQLDCLDIVRVGSYRGVPIFAQRDANRPYETVYVPVRPGVWQPYGLDLPAVRANLG